MIDYIARWVSAYHVEGSETYREWVIFFRYMLMMGVVIYVMLEVVHPFLFKLIHN